MALLWTDGMDRYGATADFVGSGYYVSSPSSYLATGGTSGGGAARCTSSTNWRKTFAVQGSTPAGNGFHFCGWHKAAALVSGGQTIMLYGTDLNSVGSSSFAPKIILNQDGSLSVTEHNLSSVTLATSAVGVITAGTYYHIEYAAKLNTGANGGYIKVWVNGNIVINFAGTTSNGVPVKYTDLVLGKSNPEPSNYDWDDIICWDETGTDFAMTQITTTYLPVIETLNVTANDTVQFTPSTGSNFQNVDDPAFHNADTDYNSSGTVGQVDQFVLADQATMPVYTFGVALKTVARIDIAGTINLRGRLISGATTSESVDHLLGTGYVLYADFWGKDPNTTAVWVPSAINSLKCGYEYQS